MKKFNTTGLCIASEHYMVDISERISKIKKMVDDGEYFAINRARQYGKTTTIEALCQKLAEEYIVLSMDFQSLEDGSFRNGGTFSKSFARAILDMHDFDGFAIPESIVNRFRVLSEKPSEEVLMDELIRVFKFWFAEEERPIVLIIDEVDSATNNQVFLDFLAQLRFMYLKHKRNKAISSFQSVIFAGVTDVKHLRSKIREEDQHKVNSPWNIAADFNIDMSLPETGIKGMLDEYEADHHTGMDALEMARQIRAYTNGYPFLVSRICQLIDENVATRMPPAKAWTRSGLDEAIKMILAEDNALFRSLTKNLNNYPDLKKAIRSILMEGARIAYNAQQDEIAQMQMYGLIRNDHDTVRVANRIFEMRLYNLFLSDEELKNNVFGKAGREADPYTIHRHLHKSVRSLGRQVQGEGWKGTVPSVPEANHQRDRELLYRGVDEGPEKDGCHH